MQKFDQGAEDGEVGADESPRGERHGAGGYRPAVANTGAWAGREAARTPLRFRERVVAAFRAPANLAYLRGLLGRTVPAGALRDFAVQTLDDAVYTWSEGSGRAYDVLWSDPVARRGALRPAVGLWDEVRRLNRVFYEERLAFLHDHARMVEAGGDEDARRAGRPRRPVGQDDPIFGDEEPYHIRMFQADSMQPPELNADGPLWEIRENRSITGPVPPGGRGANSGRQGNGANYGPNGGGGREGFVRGPTAAELDEEPHYYGVADAPWSKGSGTRSPEALLAEYYGDGAVASETALGAPEQMGQTYGDVYGRGVGWKDNGGTRLMRYPNIPRWQILKREGVDRDIEETLGLGEREMDTHVRRWDMDRVREPRGQEYRRYGVRSGHVV